MYGPQTVRRYRRDTGEAVAPVGTTGDSAELDGLGTWGRVLGLDDMPVSLVDGFVGRAFGFERAALEPIDVKPAASGDSSATGLTHAAGVGVRGAGGLAGAPCGEDTVGRYGGDEFITILPETDEAAALQLAERVRATISAQTTSRAFGPIDASIGVAQWQPGSSGEELLEAADRALRAAKAAGDGRVVGAGALQPQPNTRWVPPGW